MCIRDSGAGKPSATGQAALREQARHGRGGRVARQASGSGQGQGIDSQREGQSRRPQPLLPHVGP
eukprot:5411549-Alexandrium_andersonii.AAC.1